MKKLIAGLLFGLSLMAPVSAQNNQSRIDSYGVNGVNYSLNSAGSSYGQIFNSQSSSIFSFGYGTSQSVIGTALLSWNANNNQVVSGSTVSAAAVPGGFVVQSTVSAAGDTAFNVVDQQQLSAFRITGEGGTLSRTRTKAQLAAITPAVAGEEFICSDCTNTYSRVVATGTATAMAFREQGLTTGPR